MFLTFGQNNSGGTFDFNEEDGITHWVIIECDSVDEGVEIAKKAGVYFNGCADGRDCHCCGDRWSSYCLEDDFAERPEVYGEDVVKAGGLKTYRAWMPEGKEVCIHYKDGTKTWLGVLPEEGGAA